MCLIVYMPPGKRLPINELENGRRQNRDGFGIMYHDPSSDSVVVVKNNNSTEKGFRSAYLNVPNDVAMVVHFRMATQGAVSMANQHPFLILDKATDGIDLFMVHNGMIDGFDGPEYDPNFYGYGYNAAEFGGTACESDSDTAMFVNQIVKPILEIEPQIMYTEAFKSLLFWRLGGGDKYAYPNKLVFLDSMGQVIIINESAGAWVKGCWLSNLNSAFRPAPKYAYVYPKVTTETVTGTNPKVKTAEDFKGDTAPMTKAEKKAARRRARAYQQATAPSSANTNSTLTSSQVAAQAAKELFKDRNVINLPDRSTKPAVDAMFDPIEEPLENDKEGLNRYVGASTESFDTYISRHINDREVTLDWVINSTYEDILDRVIEEPVETTDFIINLVHSASV